MKNKMLEVVNYKELGFMEQCIELIIHFSSDLMREKESAEDTTEYEFLGKLTGFIAATDPEIRSITERPICFGSQEMQVDLFLEKSDRTVIVELISPSIHSAQSSRKKVEQVKK